MFHTNIIVIVSVMLCWTLLYSIQQQRRNTAAFPKSIDCGRWHRNYTLMNNTLSINWSLPARLQ